jgi:predicted Zn-dependent protease
MQRRKPMSFRNMLSIAVGVAILAYIAHQNVYAKEYYENMMRETENGDYIWSSVIIDGVLTYKVDEGNDMMFKKMVDSALNEWEEAMNENLVFEKRKGATDNVDIIFDEVKTLGKTKLKGDSESRKVAGVTRFIGNKDMGVINSVEVRLIQLKNEVEMFTAVKHEIGHALGLMQHNENKKSVMYESTAGFAQQKVQGCDAGLVLVINELVDEDYLDGKRCHYSK